MVGLRSHFSEADNISDTALKRYTWVDGVDSPIFIEPVNKAVGLQTQAPQKRPMLLLNRGMIRVQASSIGDSVDNFGTPDTQEDRHVEGDGNYSTTLHGEITVFACGVTWGEAEALAAETFYALTEFAPVIRRELDLLRFRSAGLGQASKLPEAREHFVVPVTVLYAFEHRWKIVNPDRPVSVLESVIAVLPELMT